MTDNTPKNIALKTLINHKYYSLNNYIDLQRIIESNQFTIIEYKKHNNSKSLTELIKRLRVEKEIEQNDSFLYINNNLKFIFINAGICDQDKCALLRHELGHICDPDLKNNGVHYSKIKKEEFANEFSCYTKNPGIRFKLKLFIMKKWKLLVLVIAAIACITGVLLTLTSPTFQPTASVISDISTPEISNKTYFVTSSGKKYHRKHCIIIKYKSNLTEMTLHEATHAEYKPCMICNPEEE